jgi:hypothetical protein
MTSAIVMKIDRSQQIAQRQSITFPKKPIKSTLFPLADFVVTADDPTFEQGLGSPSLE